MLQRNKSPVLASMEAELHASGAFLTVKRAMLPLLRKLPPCYLERIINHDAIADDVIAALIWASDDAADYTWECAIFFILDAEPVQDYEIIWRVRDEQSRSWVQKDLHFEWNQVDEVVQSLTNILESALTPL